MSATVAASPQDTFASTYEEQKYGYNRNLTIIRSTSASVSLLASLLLVWILNGSRSRFTTTFHRLILGLTIFDIMISMSLVTFGLISPADVSYVIWNARGNLATCDAFGFMYCWGVLSSSMYSASLNLYYLATVKYNMPDSYIKGKLEPLLHAVPILFGLVISIVSVAQEGINSFDYDGVCGPFAYNPPHCDGFEDGQIPDGFEIPCGRGNSFYEGLGGLAVLSVYGVMMALVIPITMGVSLFMIYRSISEQEERMMRYVTGAPGGDDAEQNNGVTSISSILTSITRSIWSKFGGESESRNQNSSSSHAVASRAAAYSMSYFVTWVWVIVYAFVSIAGAWPDEIPFPTWVVTYVYFWNFFEPLQGLWTFFIFMQSRVAQARRSSDISWISAFLDVLCLAVTGRKRSPWPCTRRRDEMQDGEDRQRFLGPEE